MFVSIIIPAHNEEAAIAATIRDVYAKMKEPFEVIVVADHCTDKTESIVQSLTQEHPTLRLIVNDRAGSFGNALITGFEHAQGDAVVPIMGDACDDPAVINSMRRVMEQERADIVAGSRYMRGGRKLGGPRLQNILSRLIAYAVRLAGVPTWDAPNAFKLYRKDMLKRIGFDIPNMGTEYSLALLLRAWRAGATILEVPTTWTWKEKPLPWKKEWRILKRWKGYWRALRG